MDLSKLKLPGPWDHILKTWRNGEKIDRAELTRLLMSGDPVPVEANEFLAEAIKDPKERGFKFKAGNAAWYEESILASPATISDLVDGMQECILDPSLMEGPNQEQRQWLAEAYKKATRKRSEGERISARQQAINQVAFQLNISPRHVETKIRQRNKRLKKMAERLGVSVDELKAALR